MSEAEGFLYIILFIEFILGLIGCFLLGCTFFLLKRIRHPAIRLAILLLGMVVNFLIFMNGDAPLLLAGTLLLGVPMAVLFPPFLFPALAGGVPELDRALICYIVVWFSCVAFPFLFVISGLSMVPAIYWHTPVSNAAIYVSAMVVDVILAAIVYSILSAITTLRKKYLENHRVSAGENPAH